MGRILLIAALWPLLMPLVSGQEVLVPGQNYYEERKGIVYNQEFAVNFKLLTNGYSLGVDIGRLQTYYLTRFWSFEIGELKHNKEYRQSFDFRSPPIAFRGLLFLANKTISSPCASVLAKSVTSRKKRASAA